MLLVGLTGGIATGKSTVSSMLHQMGCTIIDADLIAREVVEPGRPAWVKIKKYFGDSIIRDDETLDRETLGDIIFNDPAKRRKLNSFTHPEIYRSILWQILKYLFKGERFIILDLPLLYESGKMVRLMSKVICVNCDDKTQVERLCLRNKLTRSEATMRINAQMPLVTKCARADYVIDNSGYRPETKQQVEIVYQELVSSSRPWKIRLLLLVILTVGSGLLLFLIRQMTNILRSL